jgi:hypothetical protein
MMSFRLYCPVLLAALLTLNRCDQRPAAAPGSSAPALPETTARPPEPAQPAGPAWPEPTVWLEPLAPDVRLRERPSLDAPSSDMKGTMRWTGEVSAHRDVIPVRGRSEPHPWLALNYPWEVGGRKYWAYGGLLRPAMLDFTSPGPAGSSERQAWLRVEAVNEAHYRAARRKAGTDTLQAIVRPKNDGRSVRVKAGGEYKVYKDVLTDGEGHRDNFLLGEQNGWHIIDRTFYEWHDFLFVRASDGLDVNTLGYSHQRPLLSPGGHRWAYPAAQGTEGRVPFSQGIEFFDAAEGRPWVVQLPSPVADLVWEAENAVLVVLSSTPATEKSYYRLTFP